MLYTLKPFHCPNCNVAFCSRDATRQHGPSKFPLLLPCNHSVCESCLHTNVKNKSTYTCAICKSLLELPDAKESIAKLHPDVHALGILNANRKLTSSIKVRMVSTQETVQNISPKSRMAIIRCDFCSQVEALWQCDECEQNFCNLCFDQAHKNTKSKRKHEVKRIFAELYNTMVQSGCTDHQNKSVEFYCEKDATLTCSHCMLIGDHIGHEVKSLVDKNKSCAGELQTLLEEISEVEKRLRYTEHLLSEVTSGEKVDVSEYVKRIHDRFHKLHSILQLRENHLVSQLESAANLQNEYFVKMMSEISGYQKDIISMKRDAESVIENPCLAISVPNLMKKLESFKIIPRYLLPSEDSSDKSVRIDLELDDGIDDALKKYGLVDYSFKPRYHLVPSEELPENYCLDIPEKFCVSDAESQSNTTLDNFSEDSLASPNSKFGIQAAAFKYRDFSRTQPEKVLVSHIKNPSCFWIQRCAEMRQLASISDAINKWCRSRETHRNKPSEVERGDLYLVQFSQDKKWYRGRVKNILKPGDTYELPAVGMKSTVLTKEKRLVKKDEIKVEIFYIDYGNSEVVSISSLQNIQARFLNLAGLSKQCSLVDIAPADAAEWSVDAIKSFTKFVSYRPVIMQVYEERNNILQVDLSQVADNGITNDVPVSVRDALVFQELAVFPTGKITPGKRIKHEPQFLSPERLKANADLSVIVSHVESPSHLYVQQISTASYLTSMIVEMSESYDSEDNTLLHSIFAPRIGMICAAQFTLDKQWYRAQVISLPGGANVEVQYVDFGNSEIINHKCLRKLPDKWSKLNIQAIPCKLADVTYNQEKCWSNKAKEWLTNKVSKKQLHLKSLGYIPGDNKSDVVLFYKEDEYEICINALMVEEGLAASCGPRSVEVKKVIEVSAPLPPVQEKLEKTLSNESIEDKPTVVSVSHVKNKPQPSAIAKSFPETVNLKHIEVHISHVVNPSSFYVRVAGDMENKLKRLMTEMQKIYKELEMSVKDINVGKSYAVFSEEERLWYRGNVLAKNNDKVQVEFVDYGTTEEVPPDNIQKLLEKFASDEEFAIHCELSGILPAGGSNQWSYSACDAFKAIVALHEILHLACKEEISKDNKTLPVSLFIQELNLGGALEPTKIEFKNVAMELVDKGLALPVRKPHKKSNKCNSSSNSETDELSDKIDLSSSEKVVESNSGRNCEDHFKNTAVDEIKSPKKSKIVVQEQVESPKPIEPPKPAKPKHQWKPVVYPTENTFKGFVTNIGDDGSVHLHVYRDGSSVVDMISKALQFKYSKSSFQRLQQSPPIGEACIAKFSVDNKWYRAEILSLYPEKKSIKVHFVDYGNNEIISLDDIRTDITMLNFPRQCLECSLTGIHVGEPGQWDDDLLNFLHSQLVESIVEVQTLGPPEEDGKLPCYLTTSCGISVAELLNSMGFMHSVPDSLIQDKSFQKASELREGDIFPVCISEISSPNIVYLQRKKIEHPKSDYEKEHNKEHENFLELIRELQDKAETFPIVQEPMPGMACCAKYTYDGTWYRCEVVDLDIDGVIVLYVDYGNSEKIPAGDLRTLDSKFIDFPLQIHFCKIHGMTPADTEWDPNVKEFMVNALIRSDQEIFAKVVISDNISEIDLMVKDEDGNMKLAYEELVEMNLIILQKED